MSLQTLHIVLLAQTLLQTAATSIKIDHLVMAHVRTDPISFRTGLSDHVHTFFNVQQAKWDATYNDLINTPNQTGNCREDK